MSYSGIYQIYITNKIKSWVQVLYYMIDKSVFNYLYKMYSLKKSSVL